MAVNPNFPVTEHGWGPLWGANGGTVSGDRYVNVSPRTIGSIGSSRGRQYEVDQVQAGTLSAQLQSNDGALDPTNTAGPWYGHIAPYQPYRVRMQYPPTVNLLTQVQATGGDQGGYALGTIPTSAEIFSNTDSSGGSFVASGSAFQGGSVLQFAVPNATASGALVAFTTQPAIIPGQSYTMQMRVRNVTNSTSLQVKPYIGYLGTGAGSIKTFGSTVTLTGSTSATWTQVTATFTAPTNAFAFSLGLVTAATAGAACSVQVDAWQLETGSTATTFVIPGITYPLFAGFIERWPTTWTDAGSRGIVSPSAVDAFGLLSQRKLRDPLTEEIYSRNPRFLYTLGDPQGVSSFADSTGNNGPAAINVSRYGAGSLVSGTSITATDTVNGVYTGSSETVVTVNNQFPGTNLTAAASFIALSTAGITGPANPQSWTRMVAFRYTGPTPTGTNNATIWHSMDNQRANNNPSGSQISVRVSYDGTAEFLMYGPAGPSGPAAFTSFGGSVNVIDGNWHLLIFGYSQALNQVLVSQDGSLSDHVGSLPVGVTPTGLVSDNLGSFVDVTTGNGTIFTFKGDISYVAEFPTYFGDADVTAVYNAWKNSFAGDSSAQRYARILGWAGYKGSSSISTGMTASMGPATSAGSDAMSQLASVVESENGVHYVDGAGQIVFKGRNARYNTLAPAYTFGERTDLGEWPYEDVAFDYDSTHLANLVEVTQKSSGQVFSATDTASQTAYFPRDMSRTIDSTNPLECQDAANYLLSRFKNPVTRISLLRLHPGAKPDLWPICLSLEIGTRIRVMRRPLGAPAIQLDVFVEHLDWAVDDQNDAWLTIQCSPVDPTPYGVISAFHTTVNAAVTAGDSAFFINAPTDGNTGILAGQISAGTVLVIDAGTANAETVTVKAPGTTTAGWSAGSLVIVGTFTKAHAIGATVYESLPAGITNPATWDGSAKYDSSAFSY